MAKMGAPHVERPDDRTDEQGSVVSLPSVSSSSSSSSSRRHLGQPCALSVRPSVRPPVRLERRKRRDHHAAAAAAAMTAAGAVQRRRRELHTAHKRTSHRPTDRTLDLRWREERKKEGRKKSGGGCGACFGDSVVSKENRLEW